MQKIPTLYTRDPANPRHVTRDAHPACGWVFAGEAQPTRKYDGTCTMFDGARWWARREIKQDAAKPAEFVQIDHDPVTGKTVGWIPMELSSFARYHAEAVGGLAQPEGPFTRVYYPDGHQVRYEPHGTYELIGPRINGNPERVTEHQLIRHGYRADGEEYPTILTFDGLREWLLAHTWEGIVWHHPDGRMAKLKRRDFA